MKKNVASQVIGVQMVSATDGSAFTGSVTCVVTVDGGTQSASGGTGPTHEGNGLHTYSPTQAETNGDHVCFTFTGTGAVPTTVQVYTTFPQTGDSYGRIGAPANADISADIAAVKAETALIVADTGELQTDWANGGRLDLILDSRMAEASINTTAGAVDNVTLVATTTTNTDMVAAAPTAAQVADQVWLETLADHSGTSGSTAEALNAAGAAGDPWTTVLPGAYGAGSAGEILGDWKNAGRLDAILDTVAADAALIKADTDELQTDWANGGRLDLILDSRMAEASINTTAGAVDNVTLVATTTTNSDMRGTDNAATATALATVDTEVGQIKTQTDKLTFTDGANVDANIQKINDVTITGDGSGTPFNV